jgi:DeoR/GlpR family transcriptional regulator of sugar metabolism
MGAAGGRVSAGRDRRENVAALVLERGAVTIEGLVGELGVSRMTVHRDLDELERQGVLRKVRGGATASRSTLFESTVAYRLRTAVREKEAIAAAALELVAPGQAVMLDESTTMLPLARRLPGAGPLTVISNSVAIQQVLAAERSIRFIGLGGDYLPNYDAFHGLGCEQAIRALRADLVFLSVAAMDGLTTFHQESVVVATKRAMLASARRKVLLLDHGKLGHSALHQVGPVDLFDCVITDEGAGQEHLAVLRDAGVDVRVASWSPTP